MRKRITAGLMGLCMMLLSIFAGLTAETIAYAAGTTLIVHYGGRSDGNYDGWNLWIWEEGKDGQQVDFTGSDSFGQVAVYQSNNAPAKIGFIVRLNEWAQKDVEDDRFVVMDQEVVEIWVTSGEAEFTTQAPEGAKTYDFASVEEARMKLYEEEDAIKLNVHFYNFEESYSSDTLEAFAWQGEEAGGAYPYVETDEFGAVFHVGLKPGEGVDTAGLRILQNGADDAISARKIDLSKAEDNVLDVYTVEGNPAVWYSKEEVNYRPVIADAYFGETTSKQIIFTLSQPIDTADETQGSKFTVTDDQGMSYPIVKVWSEDPKIEKTAYLIMKEPLDLSKNYMINREDYEGCQVSMSKVIGSTYFDEAFAYDGDDLGAVYTKEGTKFRVWAPTAEEVSLNLYEEGDGDNLLESIPMEADEKGTWVCEKQGDLNGRYYTYSIKINDAVNEAVDLYARSTGVNGNRGMILDLRATDPEGFENDVRPEFENDTDAVIYEIHVRDLSSDPSSGIQNVGKFLGFTEKGTVNSEGLATGLDHMKDLGVTHVQILPSYDYATVDESKLDTAQFNWGYDPKNYNVPEGSYSTDPYHGEVRVKEMKQMIQTLHENDIRVIMDVVYNHTFSTEESWFQKTVPDYYYRKNGDAYSNASGCGNETASERAMMRKYMIDSVVYWAEEYHIDGFRFDLMGIHDTETMMAIRAALDEVDPSIMVYGEGWTSGDAAIESSLQATKNHTYQMDRVGAFSDDIRDGIRGNVFYPLDTGFVSGKEGLEERIKFSVVGATENEQVDLSANENSSNFWAAQPGQSINYVSCHDNLTLWDKLTVSNEGVSEEDRIKMNKLSSAIVFTSQGVPFFQAGEEMLRTKPSQTAEGGVDENSYSAPDATNSLKWDNKGNVLDIYEYYKGLIAFRKAHGALRMTTAEEIQENLTFIDGLDANVVAYLIENSPNQEIAEDVFIIYNANKDKV
ncbi:MAG: type I pullulanase, partial [Lachnospiraceae bacterium]|nr:type I pullulanase [Lachnospiraceae bacterium]